MVANDMEEVAEAIGREDFEVALVAAIARWRTHRYAVLADLVDAIAANCKPARLVGRSKDAFQKAWLDLARSAPTSDDPAVTGALIGGLQKSLPESGYDYFTPHRDVKRQRPFLERIDGLAKCADDPRVASALADLLVKAPISVDDVGGVYGPVIELVIHLGDERSVARLHHLVANPVAKTQTLRNYFTRALTDAAHAIEKRLRKRRALADADRASALALTERLGAKAPVFVAKRAVDVDALVAECLAHPGDDGPREVLADALLEREDPRGAFIHLQLRDARGALDEAERKQMASLQRKHEKTWLGDLTRCTKLRVFHRGFIDEAELLQGAAADSATWKRVAADPVVGTLRVLHKGSASEQLYRSFVFSPAMRMLRDMEVPSSAMLRAIPRRIEHIKLTGGLTKDVLAAIDEVVRTTGATRLSFDVKQDTAIVLAQLAAWESRKHFVELCVVPSYRIATDWFRRGHEWLRAFEALAPVQRLALERLGDRCTVARGKHGLVIDFQGSRESSIRMMLGHLAPIERLTLRGKIDTYSKPSAWIKNTVKKLRAKKAVVDVYDDWRSYT